jgi:GntR family transcriptional repressor for pyruvate dehydrogenase complex
MTTPADLLSSDPTRQARPAVHPGQPVYAAVLADLSERIRRGDWLPGTRLPSIARLADDLQVGSGSVREALRSMQSMGLVTIEHGRGVFVANPQPAHGLETYFERGENGALLALAETRRILEPELAALAAERGTDAELAEIEDLAHQMERDVVQGLDFTRPDVAFHHCIAGAARNVVLYRVMVSLQELLTESRQLTSQEPGMTARAVHYHLLIAGALRTRDASQARLLMLAHMNDTMSGLLLAEARLRAAEENGS